MSHARARQTAFAKRSPIAHLLLLLSFLAVGCSEAVTPNANFDAGPLQEEDDAGDDGVGGPDQPCDQGTCDTDDLVCIDDGSNLICRVRCDPQNSGDPCGQARTCVGLQSDQTQGACVPAGVLDESCPCDEGFHCTVVNGTDGGADVEVCKTACDPAASGVDGGASQCPAPLSCQAFVANPENGVCL
jgi:hypothetical protein